MKITNLFLAAISIFMVLLSGCGTSGNSSSANANIANNANPNKVKRDVKPADFTITAEELSKVFAKNEAQSEEQSKRRFELDYSYRGKTIAVTGKIWQIWRKNRGVVSVNKVFLYPALENIDKQKLERNSGVASNQAISCEFQDDGGKEIEPLKSGDTVTIQGLYMLPLRDGEPPYFNNCVVVEIK